MEPIALMLFLSIFILILYGFPVSLTLGGVATIYALLFVDSDLLVLLPSRIMGIMENFVLLAVPLFIFMGIMLEKSKLAQNLLETMAIAFGKMRGGLAVSVVIVGTMLAASTGIVGATVVTMGLISLPIMLNKGYNTELAVGTIASSGTLGQIIPPSIVLILLASVLNVPVGDLFKAALRPGLLLVCLYIAYILILASIKPEVAPILDRDDSVVFGQKTGNYLGRLLAAFIFPMILILSVLGSIFSGLATPTEAAAIGAIGAIVLTYIAPAFGVGESKAKFMDIAQIGMLLKEVSWETMRLTSMVFLILLGATTFTFVFKSMGGDSFLVDLINQSQLEPMFFLILVMIVVFFVGFFIDFIEIIFIVVPVVLPIFVHYQIDLIWVGILLALNLQTSFLTPPFGFSLFYLKGVAPPSVSTGQLYRGVIPFLLLQLLVLIAIFSFPFLIGR